MIAFNNDSVIIARNNKCTYLNGKRNGIKTLQDTFNQRPL